MVILSMNAPSHTAHPTVLLVEDEPIVRMYARDVLEEAGYHVLEAGTGQAALDVLSEHDEVEAVVTDVNMPGAVNGLALAHRVRAERPNIGTVVCSGHVLASDTDKNDVDRFISKPYTPADILKAVLDALRITPQRLNTFAPATH